MLRRKSWSLPERIEEATFDFLMSRPEALEEEWKAPLATTRIGAARKPMRDVLRFRDEEADELAEADRVHTYAGFCIAEVLAA